MQCTVFKNAVLWLMLLCVSLSNVVDGRHSGVWEKGRSALEVHSSCNCSASKDVDAKTFEGDMFVDISGPVPAVYTPFHDNGDINFSVIPEYVKYLHGIGAQAILVAGTTGEALTLSTCERKQLLEAFAEEAYKLDMKVTVHIGGGDLRSVLDLANHAQELNVSAILCLPDLFYKPKTPQELVDYLHAVSKAAPSIPLIYYHTPDRSGVNVNMRQFFKLASAQIPSFAGMKSGLDAALNVQSLLTPNQKVFISNIQVASSSIIGFESSMNGAYNMFLKSAFDILEAVKAGDVVKAREQQLALTKTIDKIADVANFYTSGKAMMEMVAGIKVGPVRAPQTPLSPEMRKRVHDVAVGNGIPVTL